MRTLALAATLVAAASPAVAADRSYICIGDKATGFVWRDNAWASTTFNVDSDRFVVTLAGLNVEVTKIGTDHPSHTCSMFAEDAQQVVCGGLGYGFVVNFTTLRYQEFYGFGYIDGQDAPGNTPSLTIGRCSPV